MKKVTIKKYTDFISVVIRVSDIKGKDFLSDVARIQNYLEQYFSDYEIVLVEDELGVVNQDNLKSMLEKTPSIRFLELSYNVDSNIAITIGLECSIGDYVITFNPQLDPLEVIFEIVRHCKENKIDVCTGIAENINQSFGYKIIRPLVNFLLREINYNIPKNATSLRCLSRNAVNSATKSRNHHQQIFVRISQCGMDSGKFYYSVVSNKQVKKTFLNSIELTLKLLVLNSFKPLRWISGLGFVGCMFSFLFACYSFLTKLISHDVADGWSSIVILISMLFGILFIILSFLGEYLGRLLNEQSKYDPYWIANERYSSVMVDVDRLNVLSQPDVN